MPNSWKVGDSYLDHRWPSGVAEIVDGSGYVVAYVPLHEGSSRNDERKHWPEIIASAAELEAQLRQEREAHAETMTQRDRAMQIARDTENNRIEKWLEYDREVAQLQTTISQLDQLITSLWDFATFTPAIGCAFEEMRVLKESLARFKASIITKPEEAK